MIYQVIDDLGEVIGLFDSMREAIKHAVELEIINGIDYDVIEIKP